MEKQFKNYKEKQQYYKQKSKNSKYIWILKEPNNISEKRHIIIKGKTYKK